MSLRYKFQKAEKIRQYLDNAQTKRLDQICAEIQSAQRKLNQKALKKLNGCFKDCQGLCCRNVLPDDLITQMDALYVWEKLPSMRPRIKKCLQHESLFTADCFFLEDGVGPCIFPADVRPEKCLITFCGDTAVIQKEIRNVRYQLNKLYRFIIIQNLKMALGLFFQKDR
jgi:hypothetical protein